MKQFYYKLVFIIAILLQSQAVKAQTTEVLETETVGSSSFTDNGQIFNISSTTGETYDVFEFVGGGWNGTAPDNRFIDNSAGGDGTLNGSSFTVTSNDGTDFFVLDLYLFCSTIGLANHSGTVTFTGRKDGSSVYTFTKSTGFSSPVTFTPNNGFTYIDFSTEGASDFTDDAIDELVFTSTGNLDYMALDAFQWDVAPVGDTAPPIVNSIALMGTPAVSATSITKTVTYDENANNITTDDFELTTTGTATGTIASVSASSGTSVDVTINAISGAGTLRLDHLGTSDVIDDLGNGNGTNGNVAAFTTGDVHTVDTVLPTLSSSTPVDDATGVPVADDITVTFSENVQFGTGFIQLKRSSDDSAVFSIDAANPTATSNVASIAGSVLTINPSAPLVTETGYYVSIPATCIDDLASNSFVGFIDNATLNFVTEDVTPPVFENSTPSATSIANTSFTLETDIDEAGTIYYVVVPDGASAPTSAEVKAGTGSGGSGQVTSGNAAVNTGGFTNDFSVTGLTATTDYDVYVVAEDDEGIPNLQVSPSQIDVTTASPPTVTFTTLADLCINAGVQAGLGGGSPTGGVYSGPGVTDDGNGMTYSFDPAAAGVGIHTITYTFSSVSETDDVEVFALPTVTFTAPADLCVDSGIQTGLGGGLATGGVYSGTGVTDDGNGMTYSFDPAAAGLGVHTITYSFTDGNGCSGSASDDVEVFGLPTVTFTAPADLCIDAGVQAGLGGGLATGGVYSGSGVTDDGNGMTYSFDPAAAGVGLHTITYSFADGNGCLGSASDDVEVFGLPTVTFTALADLCVDAGVQTGLGGGLATGGVYSGTGVTDDGNGMTYSFDPAAAGIGVHTITYTFTDANGCLGSASDDVEVFGLPTVTFTALADLCIDAGVQAGLGGGLATGGIYSGTGVTDDGNGNTYSFDPAAAGVGVHTITYSFTDGNGCLGSASDDVEVFGLPTVTFTALADLCIDTGVQAGLGGGLATGGVYSGTGVTDDGNGMTYSFDPAAAGVGVHTITYTFADGNGCSSSASDDVEVFGLPIVTFAAPADLCIDAGVQAGLGGGLATGGVYSGTGVTDDGNGMTYSFDPAAAGIGVHTITYSFTDGNGCSGNASDDVEVFGLPTVTFTALADLCIDAGVQAGLGGGLATGGVYSGTGVTDDGNGMTYSFDPAAAGVGVHTITYSFTDGNGCLGSASDDVEVFGLPTVTFTALADLCIDTGVQAGLGGGLATGGVYSGTGVTDDGNGMTYSFDPAAAGVGVHTIIYTFADGNGCSSSASDDVEVFGLPIVTFAAPADLCIDAGVQAGLGGGLATGGVYSGTGVTDDGNGMTYSFDPAAAGIGVHTITYSFTDGNGCSGNASDDVEVFGLPTVTFTALADLCIDAGVQAGLGGGLATGGVYSGTGVTDDGNGMTYSFDPAAAGVGVHTITYSFTDGNGCSGSASDDVEVFGLPVVTFTALADLCVDAGVQAGLSGGLATGGVYSGAGVTDDGNGMTYSFDPAVAGVGIHTLTYTFTDGNGCTNSASDDVEVFGLPIVTFAAPADLCVDAGVQAGLGGGLATGGVYSGTGVTDDGNGMTYSFDPAAAGVGIHTLTYTFTDGNGCTNSASDDVEVFGLPIVTFAAPADLCVDAGVQAGLGGGLATGGVYSGAGVTDDGNGMTYSFDPAAAGVGIHTLTYTFTDGNGCTNSASDDVEVFGLPIVTFAAPADLCVDAGVQAGLGGSTPTGGVYSGIGVTDDGNGTTYSFDPATAGVGTHTITYSFTDGNGCLGLVNDDVVVNDLDDASFAYSSTVYTNEDTNPAPTITGITGGSFSSTTGLSISASTGTIDLFASTPGIYVITYTTAGVCPNSDTFSLTIYPVIRFKVTSSDESEDATSVIIPVDLSTASPETVTIDYKVTGGTAEGDGIDYTLADGTLTYMPGDTSKDIMLTVIDEFTFEDDETIEITLSNPSNAILGANTTHTYTIVNNDSEFLKLENISTAITPNSDGINDTWVIRGIENFPNSIVKVYNRSGREVFGAMGYQNNWGGISKGQSDILPPGSYYYVIDTGDGTAPVDGWIFINY